MSALHQLARVGAAVGAALLLMVGSPAAAEAVWHCSRVKAPAAVAAAGAGNSGASASQGSTQTTPPLPAIELVLNDLIDAYSGQPVRVRGAPLTACFMRGASPVAQQAMKMLSLSPPQVQALGRRNALVDSSLRGVHTEADMAACIARHFPAVGYLPRVVDDERITPCF